MAYLGYKSILPGTSAECIEQIFRLHFPSALTVADATWGTGRFWKWDHDLTIHGVDIDNETAQVKADYRQLPFQRRSVDVLCFDPPFIFTPGLRRIIGTKRFFLGAESRKSDFHDDGARSRKLAASSVDLVRPKNVADLNRHTRQVLLQGHRIARQGMILKGQDLIVHSKGGPNWWSYDVMQMAERLGYGRPKDILIQHSKSARLNDPRWKTQYHFRRVHCYYIVYVWDRKAEQAEVARRRVDWRRSGNTSSLTQGGA